jgi:NADPH:quinone reductase-like Zn-dependent oxidoreductase
MRAVRFHQYGDHRVLTLEEAEEPHAGPGQVRVRVTATSVNPFDIKVRAGYLHEMMPLSFPAGTGSDAVGIVDEVGEGVGGVDVGDSVFGLAQAGAAELAVLYAWARVPEAWTTEQAAAAGLAASTAVAGLDAVGGASGGTILIEGAAGGVGSAAVQIAAARGATVIGTASEANHEFLRSLGAIPVTYGPGLADRVAEVAPGGVDAALDLAGSGSLPDLVGIVGDRSRVASAADFTAQSQGVAMVVGNATAAENLAVVAELGAAGLFTPVVAETFTLDRLGEAQARIEEGHTRGKIVVVVPPPT